MVGGGLARCPSGIRTDGRIRTMGGGEGSLKEVFYPGGYNPNPVGWRGRSLMAIGGICLTMVPIFVWSAKNESRPLPPTHWIPSQLWYDYFGNKAIGEPYTPKKWKLNE